jgi:hypothetical protein
MKYAYFLTISIILLLLFSISIYAVEGMSSDEINVREEHDKVRKELYECFAIHKVDPETIDKVCREEQIEMKKSREKFNKFMLGKTASTPYEIRQKEFQQFEEKYSVYPEDRLRRLHEESCQTKWGSSDSSECQAIASQMRKKQVEKLGIYKSLGRRQ